jgi:hypothetical protein
MHVDQATSAEVKAYVTAPVREDADRRERSRRKRALAARYQRAEFADDEEPQTGANACVAGYTPDRRVASRSGVPVAQEGDRVVLYGRSSTSVVTQGRDLTGPERETPGWRETTTVVRNAVHGRRTMTMARYVSSS